jgi:hypothetical protein
VRDKGNVTDLIVARGSEFDKFCAAESKSQFSIKTIHICIEKN